MARESQLVVCFSLEKLLAPAGNAAAEKHAMPAARGGTPITDSW
jgi:hypothetical protein